MRPFQQNLANLQHMGVVVLSTGSTKLNDLQPFAQQITVALNAVEAGKLLRVPPVDRF